METQLLDDVLGEENQIEFASFFKRLAALALDMVLILIIAAIGIYITAVLMMPFVGVMIPFTTIILYKVFMEMKDGATYGKTIMGIKVVSASGESLSGKQAMLRNVVPWVLLWLISLISGLLFVGLEGVAVLVTFIIRIALLLIFLAEIIAVFVSSENQALHDHWAKTIVIKDK